MKDLALELIIKEIFGESLLAPAERQHRQEWRHRLDSAHDRFFQRNQLAVELEREGRAQPDTKTIRQEPGLAEVPTPSEQIISKRLERVPEAKNRLLASIDRFIEQARESVRKGGHDAI